MRGDAGAGARTVVYFYPGRRMTDPGANSRILAYHIGIPLPVSYANRAAGSLLSSLELGTSVSDSRSSSYIWGHKVSGGFSRAELLSSPRRRFLSFFFQSLTAAKLGGAARKKTPRGRAKRVSSAFFSAPRRPTLRWPKLSERKKERKRRRGGGVFAFCEMKRAVWRFWDFKRRPEIRLRTRDTARSWLGLRWCLRIFLLALRAVTQDRSCDQLLFKKRKNIARMQGSREGIAPILFRLYQTR